MPFPTKYQKRCPPSHQPVLLVAVAWPKRNKPPVCRCQTASLSKERIFFERSPALELLRSHLLPLKRIVEQFKHHTHEKHEITTFMDSKTVRIGHHTLTLYQNMLKQKMTAKPSLSRSPKPTPNQLKTRNKMSGRLGWAPGRRDRPLPGRGELLLEVQIMDGKTLCMIDMMG